MEVAFVTASTLAILEKLLEADKFLRMQTIKCYKSASPKSTEVQFFP